ncbi:MAG: hypothetical protein MUC96_19785 [Myxococcaceae bacterium]|jgi:hypothetical protein|nr:hypothetical protein [Myxococcaceae bacterium]
MVRLLLVVVVVVCGCKKEPQPEPAVAPTPPAIVEQIRASEARALEREPPPCDNARVVFDGVVNVKDDRFTHVVEQEGNFFEEPWPDLDVVVARARRFQFTLEYPFEKAFTGELQGELTARKAITAIRAGFRTMYGASTVKEIPGMLNKQVTGPYGEAFHALDDLVIEGIEVCDDHTLRVSIGS